MGRLPVSSAFPNWETMLQVGHENGDTMSFDSNTEDRIDHDWAQLSRELRQKWPQLTRDDLKMTNGDSQKLVAIIHQKTGETLKKVEKEVDQVAANSGGLLSRLSGTMSEASHDAGEAVADAGHYVYDQVGAAGQEVYRRGGQVYHSAENQIRQWPLPILAATLVAGVAIGIMLVPRPRPQRHWYDFGSGSGKGWGSGSWGSGS